MADIDDLIQKLSFYQAGGKDPGTSNADKFKEGYGMVNSVISDVLAVKKANLDAKKTQQDTLKVQGENTPYRDIALPLTKSFMTRNENTTPEQIDAQDKLSAEREAMGTTTLEQEKDKATIDALRARTTLSQDVLPVRALPAEAKQRALDAGFPEDGMINIKKFNALKGFDVTTPVPVIPTASAIDAGTVPSNAKVVTPGQTGETANTAREDRLNKLVLDYSDKLENNYLLKQLQSQQIGLDTANQLDDLANQGNTVAGAALGMKQARGMGEVGVITDKDITRYVQSGKLSQKGADILSRWMTGSPTPATLTEIIEINGVIKDSMREKIQPIYNTYVNRLSANTGLSKEEAARRLDVPYDPTLGKTSGDIQPTPAQLKKMKELGIK